MKMWDDITPKTNHNQARAIMDAEKRRQKMIEENQKVLDEYMACTLPRMVRILGIVDEVSTKLNNKEK
jgi:hypothetical protein